jgi:broad specificity phosphatase PhoE
MSDLHCAATLLIARHGDAEYGHPSVLSDEGGWLSETGIAQTESLAAALGPRKVARVYTSTLARAMESGAVAAKVLGVEAQAVPGLEEFSVGALAGRPHDDPELSSVFKAWQHGDLRRCIPGGETGEEVVIRYREALQAIADQFRGETVLVFSHGGVMSFVLPRIAGNLRDDLADAKFLPNCAVAEVSVDGDGFEVLSWPGSSDRAVV